MDETVNEIIETEWNMFQSTNNIGGRAWCQDDRRQFEINRRAQFAVWDQACLESYLEDLREAERKGWNLVSFKYGYMMEDTSPSEYETVKDRLPEVGEEKQALIGQLLQYTKEWCEAFYREYPKLAGRGRPITGEQGNPYPSVLTYARGELSTYSLRTLQCLLVLYQGYASRQINLHEMVVGNELRELTGMTVGEIEKQLA